MALNLSELAIDRRHAQADELVRLAGASPDEPGRRVRRGVPAEL
jgi:hypothetical protein